MKDGHIFAREKMEKVPLIQVFPTATWNQIQPNPDTLWAISSLLLEFHNSFSCIYKTDKVESICF